MLRNLCFFFHYAALLPPMYQQGSMPPMYSMPPLPPSSSRGAPPPPSNTPPSMMPQMIPPGMPPPPGHMAGMMPGMPMLGGGGTMMGMAPTAHTGCVLMAYNLPTMTELTCDRVFNLFCLYGNVSRVKVRSLLNFC
jgi:hypothetical protein